MNAKLLIALTAMLLLLTGCGGSKTITCDDCGKTQKISTSSKMDDSWIIYCQECEAKLDIHD